jgi:hypothetical protein
VSGERPIDGACIATAMTKLTNEMLDTRVFKTADGGFGLQADSITREWSQSHQPIIFETRIKDILQRVGHAFRPSTHIIDNMANPKVWVSTTGTSPWTLTVRRTVGASRQLKSAKARRLNR